VDIVEHQQWTPAGLRSLGPTEPGYIGHYRGAMRQRDGAYHQGAVWPWLIGAFVEAWLHVRGDTPDNRREAAARFLGPLLRHFESSAPGHVGEIADGDAPHRAAGCPFQAWSVGEALRLAEDVLHVDSADRMSFRAKRGILGVLVEGQAALPASQGFLDSAAARLRSE
jgi:glycogen debranching enzyme